MSGRSRWTQRAVLAALIVLVLVAVSKIEHTTPLLLPMVLLVGAVVAIVGLAIDTGGADPADWTVATPSQRASSGQDMGLAGNVRLIENHLSARQADSLLRGKLTRLTDDRLARLGLRRGDPGVAARLGPTLTGILDGPPRMLRPAEIDECISRIEELSP